jgi:hypothetical protein
VTQLLQQAIEQLQKLPASEQDAMATIILAELADDANWDSAFANSQQELSRLAEKVREDIRLGHVRDSEMDEL